MSELPLVEGVLKYVGEKKVSFHMPGHKGGLGFLETTEGKELYDNFIESDITEVDGVDNLHHPEGIIRDAQDRLSQFYKSKKSYFLVNGSTSGNLTMIFSSFKEGDKVIVERNCHRSIFNAIIMRKLVPVYIKNKINVVYNAPLAIDEEHFISTVEQNTDAKGIIITYPNYYGTCADLSKIIGEAKKFGMKVLVDSAHGAHFGVHVDLPASALSLGADMVVMSAHKTLPSLTQTAFLHIGKDAEIEMDTVDFYVSSLLSTSPSFPLLCSMDYARFFLEKKGYEAYSGLLSITKEYRDKINKLQGFHIVSMEDDIDSVCAVDHTRYILHVERGYCGHKLYQYLRMKGMQSEMSDDQNVVLIFSPFNTREHFDILYNALKDCDLTSLRTNHAEMKVDNIPQRRYQPFEVMEKKKEKVNLEEAVGKVSAVAVVPYPPGIPIIMPGELIDKEVIESICYYHSYGITILGIEEGKVSVVVD